MQPREAYDRRGEFGTLLALLRLLSDEVQSMARDIARLGEALSCENASPSHKMQNLQAFDPISQRALSHARILNGIEHMLSGNSADWRAHIEELIQSVPFHADRKRLQAVLRGEDTSAFDMDDLADESFDLF